MDQQTNQEIATVEEAISQIQRTLDSQSQDWRSYLPRARAIIALLENTPIILELLDMERRTSTLATLQQLSYQDPDNGGERDIARWCERQWATILQAHPNNARALQGMLNAGLSYSGVFICHISKFPNSTKDLVKRGSSRVRKPWLGSIVIRGVRQVTQMDLHQPAQGGLKLSETVHRTMLV